MFPSDESTPIQSPLYETPRSEMLRASNMRSTQPSCENWFRCILFSESCLIATSAARLSFTSCNPRIIERSVSASLPPEFESTTACTLRDTFTCLSERADLREYLSSGSNTSKTSKVSSPATQPPRSFIEKFARLVRFNCRGGSDWGAEKLTFPPPAPSTESTTRFTRSAPVMPNSSESKPISRSCNTV